MLLPALGFGKPDGRMAIWQPYLWCRSADPRPWAGLVRRLWRAARKVAGAEQALVTLPQKIGMGMMGLGGAIAVIGGIMFILVCLKAMTRKASA